MTFAQHNLVLKMFILNQIFLLEHDFLSQSKSDFEKKYIVAKNYIKSKFLPKGPEGEKLEQNWFLVIWFTNSWPLWILNRMKLLN